MTRVVIHAETFQRNGELSNMNIIFWLLYLLNIKVSSCQRIDAKDSYEFVKLPWLNEISSSGGGRCTSRNVSGVCVDYRWCPTYDVDAGNGDPPPTCDDWSYELGMEMNSKFVCCDACHVYTDQYVQEREQFELEKQRKNEPTGVKHLDNCVHYHREYKYECKPYSHWTYYKYKSYNDTKHCYHINYRGSSPTGGGDSLSGEFPHMALLGYGEDVDSASWDCGGSLLSEQHVLTAAHCGWHARLVVMSWMVLPACLSAQPLDEEEAYATGWGGLGHRQGNADTLQKVKLDRFTSAECSSLYRPHRLLRRGINHTTQMCYGGRDQARDTCGGDSGGPLQVKNTALNCVWTIIGVTSYGRACGFAGEAGVYTRVKHYIPWIESIVWP